MNTTKYKIENCATGASNTPDFLSDAGFTAAILKAIFNARSNGEIKEKHNGLVDAINEVEEEIRLEIYGIVNAITETIKKNNELEKKIETLASSKVDKEEGKGLSSNDFTEDYRIMVMNADVAALQKRLNDIEVALESILALKESPAGGER